MTKQRKKKYKKHGKPTCNIISKRKMRRSQRVCCRVAVLLHRHHSHSYKLPSHYDTKEGPREEDN